MINLQNLQMTLSISLIFTLTLYYCIKRFFIIFWYKIPKYLFLSILWLVILCAILCIIISTNSKPVDIRWTLISRLFVFLFLLTVFLAIEHIISHRYKINKRIIIWLIFLYFGLWTFFALTTKRIELNIQSDKIQQDTKILFLTDVHADHLISTFQIKKIKKAIIEENPDFVIIAWDLLNKANTNYVKYYDILNTDEINVPIIAVMGNHDVMWNSQAVNELSKNPKIRFLFNESIEINWIQLIWIIDKSVRWWSSLSDHINETEFNNDENLYNIFITHQPISLQKLENYPIDLELAWHTHNWQIFWIRELVHVVNDYWYWKYDEKWKTAYISQWIGFRWLPFRLWTQSEMVIINLANK